MKTEFRGFRKIFAFTLKTLTSSKGWRSTTLLLAVLFFLIPVILLFVMGTGGNTESKVYSNCIQTLYVVDETGSPTDLTFLNTFAPGIVIETCTDYDDAVECVQAEEADAAVLRLTYDSIEYKAELLLPETENKEKREALETDVSLLSEFLSANFHQVTMQKSGLSSEQFAALAVPINIHVAEETEMEETAEEDSMIQELIRYLLPYLTVMILYFLVLFYGQSVAQSVIIEKTSKLMDTFLISVQPSAMIFGKVFACVSAAIIQLLLWVLSLIIGFTGGLTVLQSVNPETASTIRTLVEQTEILHSLFSPAGIVLSVLIMLSGFLLYCSLAAIGGALASKQEDLQSTNLLFTMALVVSFMAVLFGGGLMSGDTASAAWQNWIPFTAVLITPSRVLTGDISIISGTMSLAVVLSFFALLLYFSGRLYKIMSLYKGNLPKLSQIFSMLKNK